MKLRLVLTAAALYLSACTPVKDWGQQPVRVPDAWAEVVPDAGTDAATMTDALVDTGLGDSGSADAGAPDVGTDAGPLPCPPPGSRPGRQVGGTLSADPGTPGRVLWDCYNDYILTGSVLVPPGITLEIRPSVTIRALSEPGNVEAIVVSRDGHIEAVGEPDAPITFTSEATPRGWGDWRGLVLLGRATTNLNGGSVEGLPSTVEYQYGGSDDEYDCGHLRYVRVQFAGDQTSSYTAPVAGLTLAGCGRGTEVEFVQVHGSADGIGIIGGTVALRNVVVTTPRFVGLNWTGGYRGLIQGLVIQTFYGAEAGIKGSTGDAASDPYYSRPAIYNATIVGASAGSGLRGPSAAPTSSSGFETGIVLQFGTSALISNSIVQGFASGYWLNILNDLTATRLYTSQPDALLVRRTIFHSGQFPPTVGDPQGEDTGEAIDEGMVISGAMMNARPTSAAWTGLENPFRVPPLVPEFFTQTGYVGGFAGENVSMPGSLPLGWDSNWSGDYERRDYAGAFDRIILSSPFERMKDWTGCLTTGCWTDYPLE